MIKKIVFAVLFLGILGASVGYYMFNKPLDRIESMRTNYKMSTDDLLMSFENDETEANRKFLDKVIEVTGKVLKVETENGTTSIYLATENELSSIIFQMEESDPSIKEGQEVTLKGICTGYLMDVVLVRSIKI